MTIDGYTQPGARGNTEAVGTDAVLLIELDGGVAGSEARRLSVDASNVVVKGLAINGFDFEGIIANGANTGIEGNFLGTDPFGRGTAGNGAGVTVRGPNATVGGAAPEARNLISGNTNGLFLSDSGAKVRGNLISTGKDGASPCATTLTA